MVLLPNIVNVGYFTLIKMGRTSGEPQKIPFLGIQSYYLRIAEKQGFTGWNYQTSQMMRWDVANQPKTFHWSKIQQHKAFWPTLDPFKGINQALCGSISPKIALLEEKIQSASSFSILWFWVCCLKATNLNMSQSLKTYLNSWKISTICFKTLIMWAFKWKLNHFLLCCN